MYKDRRGLYLTIQILLYYPILILLHVSAVHIGHHQVGHWFTKIIKRERLLLKNSMMADVDSRNT